MAHADRDALHVDVPVGFLLSEYREVEVTVDRPDAAPLAIRLRLIPAAADAADFGASPVRTRHDTRADAGDVDRWLEISDLAEDHGVDLLEWYVIGPDGASCPRDRLGEPPRW